MNKNELKKYAVRARRKWIAGVSRKAAQYGITETGGISDFTDMSQGKLLTEEEKKQRMTLIERIRRNGYSQVIEDVAYTWFIYLGALRFMEINGYLPSDVRIFTDDVFAYKKENKTEERQ